MRPLLIISGFFTASYDLLRDHNRSSIRRPFDRLCLNSLRTALWDLGVWGHFVISNPFHARPLTTPVLQIAPSDPSKSTVTGPPSCPPPPPHTHTQNSDLDQMPVFCRLGLTLCMKRPLSGWKEGHLCLRRDICTRWVLDNKERWGACLGVDRWLFSFFLSFFSLVAWGSETLCSEMSHLLLSATLYAADVAFILLSGVRPVVCFRRSRVVGDGGVTAGEKLPRLTVTQEIILRH